MDFFTSTFSDIGSLVLEKLNEFLGMILFWITARVVNLLEICESLFNIFSGTNKIRYADKAEYLIDVFFKNNSINNVYWAMALLGIVFVIGFTIVAVTRKSFDLRDAQKQTMGTILGSMFKSILTILTLSLIMSGALSITNQLVISLGDIFNNADSFNRGRAIEYTNEDYATMARIYKTIGNYSLNPSYSNTYNMNSCFNDIRQDLQYLEDRGIFDEVYPEPGQGDDSSLPVTWSWQSVLQKIVYAADLSRDAKIDAENENLFQALELAMNQIRTNSSFRPIDHFTQDYSVNGSSVSIARVVFLSGTASAARNPSYNRSPYITDGLRGAYYRGQKDITSYDTVKKDFDTTLSGINYILIAVLAFFTIKALFHCIVACVSRIINMVGLYIIAPLAISTMPTDDGAKFKQWTTSMIVQMLGIFGYIIPMRLLILFVPILMGESLVLFDNVVMNYLAKAFLVVGSVFAIQEFSGIINGILADMAGHAALDSGKSVQRSASMLAGVVGAKGWSAAKTGAVGAMKYGVAPAVGGTLGAVSTGIVGTSMWAGGKVKQLYNWGKDKFTGNGGPKGAPANLSTGAKDSGSAPTGGSSASGGQPTNYQGSAEPDRQSQSDNSPPPENGGSDQPGTTGQSPTNPVNYSAVGSEPNNGSPSVSSSGQSETQAPTNAQVSSGAQTQTNPQAQPKPQVQQGSGVSADPNTGVKSGAGGAPSAQQQVKATHSAPTKTPPPKNYNNQ